MKDGFEQSDKEGFDNFIRWYSDNISTLTNSKFTDKMQYKNNEGRRIAYHVIPANRYMIAEDEYTYFLNK